jgi:hypothetical protein
VQQERKGGIPAPSYHLLDSFTCGISDLVFLVLSDLESALVTRRMGHRRVASWLVFIHVVSVARVPDIPRLTAWPSELTGWS